MGTQPKRIIEAAVIQDVGPIRAAELLAMQEDSWGILRDRITDHRNGKDGLSASCMACESAVYIKTRKLDGVSRPLFAHYTGGDPTCRWHHDPNVRPDDARAAQYQGKQESNFHRQMCLLVAELVALDERHVKHSIAEYLPPTANDYGRFPDVYVEWERFGSFAIEFQMSGTFQTEISARCKHYEYEGIPLLWILFGIETTKAVSQSFSDVIRRHRGNAFVLDREAIAASREQKTLVLSCFLRNDTGFDAPRLVRFDELTIPRSKLPYHEDRIVTPLLAEVKQRRKPWFGDFKDWDHLGPLRELDLARSRLVAAAFSIVATANGKEQNFASNHKNIRAMLNTYLNSGTLGPFANLLTHLITNSRCNDLLLTKVGEHLRRRYKDPQADEESMEWRLLRELLPEAMNPVVREELIYLDSLPDWAQPR